MQAKKGSFKGHFSAVSLAACGVLGLIAANVQADSAKLLWTGNGHYYQRFDNSTITWTDAKTACENKVAHLATITSATENTFIKTKFLASAPGYYYALGASDAVQEGAWKWVTGEPWSYTDWSYFNNSSSYNYLYTDSDSGWLDDTANTSSRDGYICEWSYNTFINSVIVPDLNGNGKAELANLYVDYVTGKHTVKINDSGTGALLSTLTFATSYTAPLGLVTVSDLNNNSIPEIAVLAGNIVTIKDAKNNNAILIGFAVMVNDFGVPTGYKAKNISVSGDLNGNGSSELSIMGVNSATGKTRVEIRDSKTGQLINAIVMN